VTIPSKLPDITPAQIAAVLGWVGAQLIAFQVIDARREQVLVSAGATVIAAALKIADAVIRAGRAKVVAAAVAKTPVQQIVASGSQPITLAQPPSS